MVMVGFMDRTAEVSNVRLGNTYVNFRNEALQINDRLELFADVWIRVSDEPAVTEVVPEREYPTLLEGDPNDVCLAKTMLQIDWLLSHGDPTGDDFLETVEEGVKYAHEVLSSRED